MCLDHSGAEEGRRGEGGRGGGGSESANSIRGQCVLGSSREALASASFKQLKCCSFKVWALLNVTPMQWRFAVS